MLEPSDAAASTTALHRVPPATAWPVHAAYLAAAYLVAGKLALLLAIPPGYATAVWPAAGVALAGMLIAGYRVWPGILVGSFLVNVGVSFDASNAAAVTRSIAVAGAIATGAALQAAVGVALIRRWVGYPTALDDEWAVARFMLLGGPIGCLVNATCSVTTLLAIGAITPNNYLFSWGTWWIGDTIGVFTVAPLVLVWFGEPRASWRRRRLSVTLPVCVTIALAVTFFVSASAWEQEHLRQAFRSDATPIHGKLMRNLDMQSKLEVLYAVRDFKATVPRFTSQAFRSFVQHPLSRNPGILALSWNPRIADSERAMFESAVQREGNPGFRITEQAPDGTTVAAAGRATYVPVRYIEPIATNRRAFGYDIASDPIRREALLRARDDNRPIATALIPLVQKQTGLLVLLPVYRAGAPSRTLAQRHANLEGYVVGVFRVDSLIGVSPKEVNTAQLILQIYDLSVPHRPQRIYSSLPSPRDSDGTPPTDGAIGLDETRDIAGRTWLVRLTPTADYLATHRGWQAWSALVGALLFISLLGAFLLVITGRTSGIELLVEQRTQELARVNRALMDEVRLRQQSEATLHESNLALRNADQAKDRFLAGMSHELRTPLNAIIGFTGTLLLKLPGPLNEAQEKQLRTVRTSARHLLSLINDLLDLTRIESGKVEVKLEPVSCADIVTEVSATLRPLAEEKGLAFDLVLPPASLQIRADRRALAQILINLVNNAIKFTERGSVQVRCRQTGPMDVAIEVADTGIGIAPQDQAKLFQAFTQLDASPTRRFEGTGLGLHLSQKLAGLIGGRITLSSEVGVGSVFTLHLGKA